MATFITAAQRAELIELYVGLFNRAPEADGLNYWAGQLADGQSLEEIADAMYDAALGLGFYSKADTVEAFVTKVYNNALGRTPDEEGLAYWSAEVESGAVTPGELVIAMINAAKDYADDAEYGWVTTYLNNRTAVGEYFANNSAGLQGDAAIAAGTAIVAGSVTPATAMAGQSVAQALASAMLIHNGPDSRPAIELTLGRDKLAGTAGNDYFVADIIDNANTLQNGDIVDGGEGYDVLVAEIGNSQNFAISLGLDGVEQVALSARTVSWDMSDNNINNGRGVQIDAGRADDVAHWTNFDSRADLIIEDVNVNWEFDIVDGRLETGRITRDVTIEWADSDPGNVDFAVYFDQQSLIAADRITTNTLNLTIANPLEVSKGFNAATPLENVPYDQFSFVLNGETVTVDLDLSEVLTYDDLAAALELAFAAYPEITLDRLENGANFVARDGQARASDLFFLSVESGSITPAAIGWNATGGLPSDNAFSAIVEQGDPSSVDPLITSTIILDNVGRGSTGGDLVIGGMSTGLTSGSKGVEQFDITVEQTSSLQTLSSTANTLEVINLRNDGIQYVDIVDGRPVARFGNLNLMGAVNVAGFGFDTEVDKNFRPSDFSDQDIVGADAQNNGFGITDVRVVDAASFQGDINLTAVLTSDIVAKYADHFLANPGVNGEGNVEFNYTLGEGNDGLSLALSSANLPLAGTATRNEFELNVNGGAGDDTIEVAIYDENVFGVATIDNLALYSNDGGVTLNNWYTNSWINGRPSTYTNDRSNLNIDAGAGDDNVYVYGSGDYEVDLSTGSDTVYLADSGNDMNKAVWVFNTADQVTALSAARNILDLQSDFNDSYGNGLFKSTLTINFRGVTKEITLGANVNTDLALNHAIRDAINNDAVLGELLTAVDGPGNTLIVRSQIDGGVVAGDLAVTVAAPTSADVYTAEALAEYATANGLNIGSLTAAGVFAAVTAEVAAFNALGKTDYASAFASVDLASVGMGAGVQALAGAASAHVGWTEVTVNLDGTDVIVLSTNPNSDEIIILEGVQDTEPLVVLNYDVVNDAFLYSNADGTVTAVGLNAAKNEVGYVNAEGTWVKVTDITLVEDSGIVPPPPGPVQTEITVTDGMVDDLTDGAYKLLLTYGTAGSKAANFTGFGADDTIEIVGAPAGSLLQMGTSAADQIDFAYGTADFSNAWLLYLNGLDSTLVSSVGSAATTDAQVAALNAAWGTDWLEPAYVPTPATVVTVADLGNYPVGDGAYELIVNYNAGAMLSANISGFGADDSIEVVGAPAGVQENLYATAGNTNIDLAVVAADFSNGWTLNLQDQATALVDSVAAAADQVAKMGVLDTAWGAEWLVVA